MYPNYSYKKIIVSYIKTTDKEYKMDINNINTILNEFSKERGWDKFHSPKNLSMALSVESSELLEIFQWLSEEESNNLSSKKKEHAKTEVADIAIYLLRICNKLDINLEQAILEKIEESKKKYPENEVYGSAEKCNRK